MKHKKLLIAILLLVLIFGCPLALLTITSLAIWQVCVFPLGTVVLIALIWLVLRK